MSIEDAEELRRLRQLMTEKERELGRQNAQLADQERALAERNRETTTLNKVTVSLGEGGREHADHRRREAREGLDGDL